MMIYPSNKTLSLGDRNVSGINIATHGQTFSPNTINLGNTNSLIHMSGKVGIGTTPSYPLHVTGSVNRDGTGGHFFGLNNTLTSTPSPSGDVSICTTSYVWSELGFIASSDRRIKTDIVDIQDDAALQLFRRIQPKMYSYKDTVARGTEPVYGFIAQEVRDILPIASKLITDTIPNLYTLSSVNGDILALDPSKLEYDASGQLFPKLKLIKEDNTDLFVNILSIEENAIRIDQTLPDTQVFVYGQEVNNFHTLNKDAIWTVTTAALQEVDRQLQVEKEQTRLLQTQVAELKTSKDDILTTVLQEVNQQMQIEKEKTRLLQIQVAELKTSKENSLQGELRELQQSYNHLLQQIQDLKGLAP